LHGAVGLGGSTGGGPNGPYSLLSGFHESKIRAGWVVGAGVEHQSRIWNNAILSLAYQYVDLGEINVTQTVSATGTDGTARGILNASADASFHVIRAGASWRMGQSPYNAYASADRRAPAAFGWSGFYIGAHAGGIWSANDLMDGVTATANLTGSPSATGVAPGASDSSWLFGTQAGYNFQSGPIVYGVEVDGSVTKLNAASGNASARINPAGQPDVTALAEAGASLGWLSTIRGRLGYAFGPTLVYGTGGLAIGKVNFHGSTNVGGSVGGGPAGNQGQYASFSESSVEVGWTAGAGIDYQLRNNWILNLAYQYVDLGDISATRTASITNGGTTGSATVDAKTNLTFHTARVGISWRN